MVKDLSKFSEEKKEQMFLYGIGLAMGEANSDKVLYQKYKAGRRRKIPQEKIPELNILALLEGLGFPMRELGTYLYKDVVYEAMKELDKFSVLEESEKLGELLRQLNDVYSSFYHNIAREDKEMGVKTFHLYIEKALSKIDKEKINQDLAGKVFGNCDTPINYGVLALQLALYESKLYSFDEGKEYQEPKVMSLPNMPQNIRLKANF